MPLTHRLTAEPYTGKAGRPSVFTRKAFVAAWPLWELRLRTGRVTIAAAADALGVSARTLRRLMNDPDYRKKPEAS